MKKYLKAIIFFTAFLHLSLSFAEGRNTYQVLTYHDIFKRVSNVSDDALAKAYAERDLDFINLNLIGHQDTDSVELDRLINQFAWLKDNGYHVISIQNLLDAGSGKKPLPDKAILITFDDGYQSFYQYVFPLLEIFQYPALLAIEGSWINTPEGGLVAYGEEKIPRERFLTKEQIQKMVNSGLVEVASHTWDLHKGVLGNPQGNLMPAVTTRIYDPKTKSYERDGQYKKRLSDDFAKNNEFIESIIGKKPRVMVWPFGSYNGIAQDISSQLGMKLTMTLEDDVNKISRDIEAVKRYYIFGNPTLSEFTKALEKPEKKIMRVMHVDLDYIYDKDPTQQEKNLGLLLERINKLGANVVFLQAYSDDEGKGEASSLYFPNRHLPMKADLFSRVSWQIRTRTSAREVYAWLPLLAFMHKDPKWESSHSVRSLDDKAGIGYRRLSPFSKDVRQYIQEIYVDLAKSSHFTGLLIHDDATLSDYEDVSFEALEMNGKWGLPPDVAKIRANKEFLQKWTRLKTQFLSKFANDLRSSAQQYRMPLGLARNYYAAPILNPAAEEWFAQSYPDALENFDWVAIMAMPYFEKVENPESWLKQLVHAVKNVPSAKDKTIFELQAKDWNKNQPVSNGELLKWMKMLRVEGMQNFGYYPDDPFKNHPNVEIIKREFSTRALLE